jgi:hypothetical protein
MKTPNDRKVKIELRESTVLALSKMKTRIGDTYDDIIKHLIASQYPPSLDVGEKEG